MSDAFLLGAGFSRAISPVMPITNELGNRVIGQQQSIHASKTTSHSSICDGLSCDWPVLPREFPDIDFEGWLSELGEPQPYLFGPENDRRRALFDELAGDPMPCVPTSARSPRRLLDALPSWDLRVGSLTLR